MKERIAVCLFILVLGLMQKGIIAGVDDAKMYDDYQVFQSAAQELKEARAGGSDENALLLLNTFFARNPDNKFRNEMVEKACEIRQAIAKSAMDFLKANTFIKPVELYLLLVKYESLPTDSLTKDKVNELRNSLPREMKWDKDKSEMVIVTDGEFTMGSDARPNDAVGQAGEVDEQPEHKVYLDIYYVDKYEVTIGQFDKFCKETGYKMPEQPEWNSQNNQPVVNVSFEDAQAYCRWVGKRLPTEAEWEKAARGVNALIYPWGNEWNKAFSNNYESQLKKTTSIGAFKQGASAFGCFDMAGNVWEWCSDWYDQIYYKSVPKSNPAGPETGEVRVLRGGSWRIPQPTKQLRCANRCAVNPNWVSNDTGFRTVFSLK